ncbi:unnamed protein product [Litomosoides sigmodontis]|uniref:ubiquitinyl hydrolase 1 n=1 Tax=Litomosoides sigmodontis TaxID=42156 RepID=A0A3P6SQ36_LITSI|nr:unnamed protein product [Litomosoides sigmodontis]
MSHSPGNLWKWQWPLMKCSWSCVSHYLFTSVLLMGSLIGAVTYLYSTSRRLSRTAFRPLANGSSQSVPAMFNLGNTCFANSLLQGLASSKAFLKWVQAIDTRLVYDGRELMFLDALKRVVRDLNDTTKDICSAADVIDTLLAHGWSIPPNTEQDLYELFNVFVTTWDEELAGLRHSRESSLQEIVENERESTTSLSPSVSDEAPSTSSANISRRNVGYSTYVEGDKKIHDVSLNSTSLSSLKPSSLSFEHVKSVVADDKLLKPPCMGLLAIQLRCCKEECGYKKIREEKFCVLSLSLPKSPNALLTLSGLLDTYFTAEYIQGASCGRCLKRKDYSSSGLMKKQGFCKLPSLLIFRIERVGFSPNGYVFKRTERFLLPEFIDVREYCFFSEQMKSRQTKDPLANSCFRVLGGSALNTASSIPEIKQQWQQATPFSSVKSGTSLCEYDSMFKYKYQLRAISVHIGQAHSGHFITYRRGIGVHNRSIWYKTSDTEVTPVSFAEVASSEAYMLFYDRALTTLN